MTVIVDYQMGNLRSVQKAVEKAGGHADISSDPDVIASARSLILPGVGAFGDAMKELRRRDLISPIRHYVASGRPFLGICLGLQLLFEHSDEGGSHEGLGILAGDVVRVDEPTTKRRLKVPHMGWNTITKHGEHPSLADVEDGEHFYFVHSHYVRPTDPEVVAMTCEYGDTFVAAVAKDGLLATQFHPEKSQGVGLKLMKGFLALAAGDAIVSGESAG